MKKYFIITLLVLLILTMVSCGKKKVDLKLNLKEGNTYSLKSTTDQVISQEIQGQKMDMKQITGMGYTFNVEKVDEEGNATAKITYDSVYFKQESPQASIEYDSKNPPEEIPPPALGFAALVGSSVTMVIGPDGTVKDIEGADEMLDSVMEKLPDVGEKEVYRESLKEQFGDTALKNMMEQQMAIYPDKPVEIGESWSKKMIISSGVPMTIDNTWTLKSIEDGEVALDVKSDISSNTDGEPIKMGPLEMKYDITEGSQEGTIYLDEETGWVIGGENTQNITGNVTMSAQGQELEIPITMESKIHYDPIEKP